MIWRDVVGYEGLYQISSTGLVKSLSKQSGFYYKSESILKSQKKNNGYYYVDLYKDGNKRKKHMHRLVAQAFIKNPNNKPEVNHIDENKSNNSVENLEWVTSSENKNHGTYLQRSRAAKLNQRSTSYPVLQYTLKGDLVKEYPSTKEVLRQTGIGCSSIVRCCRRRGTKTCKGYIWDYKYGVYSKDNKFVKYSSPEEEVYIGIK